ncbi:hypothetical protein G7Y89_g3688 [Cudoniella acicularis]|uniref:Uncharacterized protein n=1 Tax=Cudoniella acicularis TaxID=354080 RepID=A0A8H4RSX2_9HELO|nr:hypothetical protein G7Y89_g3688 [Cudoniella acicularis]
MAGEKRPAAPAEESLFVGPNEGSSSFSGINCASAAEKAAKRQKGPDAPDLAAPHKEFIRALIGKGTKREEFLTYKDEITYWSDHFKGLVASVEDSPDFVIQYPDTTPEAFGLFQRWMLSKSIKDHADKLPPNGHMVRLFVLGIDIGTPEVANAAIRGLFQAGWNGDNLPDQYSYIYHNTRRGSPLRKLLVDQIIRLVPQEDFERALTRSKTRVEIPPQLIIDIAIAQSKLLPNMRANRYVLKVGDYEVSEREVREQQTRTVRGTEAGNSSEGSGQRNPDDI